MNYFGCKYKSKVEKKVKLTPKRLIKKTKVRLICTIDDIDVECLKRNKRGDWGVGIVGVNTCMVTDVFLQEFPSEFYQIIDKSKRGE